MGGGAPGGRGEERPDDEGGKEVKEWEELESEREAREEVQFQLLLLLLFALYF